MSHPALECQGLDLGYGELTVARSIELRVSPGEVLAVLGPNGAGKTTLLLTLAGFLPPLAGMVTANGTALAPGAARKANKAGVVLVPDNRALFTQLTTEENLELAAVKGGPGVAAMLELFPALANRISIKAGMLSGGEQQMLAVARALVQAPKVLLIDEMSMGLAPVVVESLMPMVRRIADQQGAAVLLVEQHVHLALAVADQAMVLNHGEVALRGSASAVRSDNDALNAAYLGTRTGSH